MSSCPLPPAEGSRRRRDTTLGEIVRAWIESPHEFFVDSDLPQADTMRPRARHVSVEVCNLLLPRLLYGSSSHGI